MFSDSFAGIAPASVPGFVLAELLGAAAAMAVHRWLGPAGQATPAPQAVAVDIVKNAWTHD